MKNKIKFSAKSIYGMVSLKPACEKSQALFELMGRYVKTTELAVVSKMGFEVDVSGETVSLKEELKKGGEGDEF